MEVVEERALARPLVDKYVANSVHKPRKRDVQKTNGHSVIIRGFVR